MLKGQPSLQKLITGELEPRPYVPSAAIFAGNQITSVSDLSPIAASTPSPIFFSAMLTSSG